MKVDPITNFDVKLIIEDPPLPPKKNTHTVTKSNIKITERDKTPNTQILASASYRHFNKIRRCQTSFIGTNPINIFKTSYTTK